MQQVYLTKGQRFEMVPAIVSIGESENTKSLVIDHGAMYDKIIAGLPAGHAVVVGKFQAEDGRVHPVIVERGTGKYFYDTDTVVSDGKSPVQPRNGIRAPTGRVYLGTGVQFTLAGTAVMLGARANAEDASINWGSAIDLAGGRFDPTNTPDNTYNGVLVGEFTDYDAEDNPEIHAVYLELFTERFYYYNK